MTSPDTAPTPAPRTGWASLKDLTKYQWFVFIVCCLAWDLDCMDQQLFVLARDPAITSLVKKDITDPAVSEPLIKKLGPYATAVFMIGWAFGGIAFGILGDRMGRVKTLTLTIGLYALFTGLSSLSQGTPDFMIYRFLTGIGVGGAFSSAAVLLAETVNDNARPYMLGLFQASSVLGNITAALISMYLAKLKMDGAFKADDWFVPWRIMFLIGIIPGILLVIVQFTLKEPDKWLKMKAEEVAGKRKSPIANFFGTLTDMLTISPWSRRAVCGLLLTGAGVIGLWGIGFFAVELTGSALKKPLIAEGLTGDKLEGELSLWKGITSLMQNGGAFLGMFCFSLITGTLGRKPTFAIFFVLAALATAGTFAFLKTRNDIFWMIPIMGFCQLALFGGFAIYLPELFPTKYRSTGTSFCYNAGRLISATGPLLLGQLSGVVFATYGDDSIRYAGVTMCSIFFIGILVLPFLPETKGKPLPE